MLSKNSSQLTVFTKNVGQIENGFESGFVKHWLNWPSVFDWGRIGRKVDQMPDVWANEMKLETVWWSDEC